MSSCVRDPKVGLAATPYRTYRGMIAKNDEVTEFVDCNTQALMLLTDTTQALMAEIKKLGATNLQGAYIELRAIAISADSLGMAMNYDSVLQVQKIIVVRPLDAKNNCAAVPKDVSLRLSETGFSFLPFTAPIVLTEEQMRTKFKGFTYTQTDSDNDESNCEWRRGFGTVRISTDTTFNISEATLNHPEATDQYGVKVGMTFAEVKAARSGLVNKNDVDLFYLFAPQSHIGYLFELGANPKDPAGLANKKVDAIVWRRKAL